jgi:hypothetical protein
VTQRPSTGDELDALGARIEAWLDRQRTENPVVAAVERDALASRVQRLEAELDRLKDRSSV